MAGNQIEQFRQIWLDNLPLLVRVTDFAGACIYVNDEWMRFSGRTSDEEMNIGWLDTVHFEDRENYARKLKTSVESATGYAIDIRLQKNVGEYRWFLATGKPVYDYIGKYVYFVSVYTDITDRKKKEEELLTSLKGKEVLLREIHHRVKNNMAVVAGMLDLHMDYVNNPADREIFLACQSRVLSMALIHEKLYRSETLSKINFKNYIEDLVKKVSLSYMERLDTIEVKIQADDTELELEKAMPCGLILNELITNAFKHAFTGLEKGEIRISFAAIGKKYTLVVSDNGIGIKDEEQLQTSGTLGYTLIAALTKQLDAEMEIKREKSLSVKFTF